MFNSKFNGLNLQSVDVTAQSDNAATSLPENLRESINEPMELLRELAPIPGEIHLEKWLHKRSVKKLLLSI